MYFMYRRSERKGDCSVLGIQNSAALACEGVDENARAWTKTRGNPDSCIARASNELMQSAVRAVLLQCRRRSRPSQNASTHRGCLPQRPDPCRHSVSLYVQHIKCFADDHVASKKLLHDGPVLKSKGHFKTVYSAEALANSRT